jgi:hypothetical protein
MITVGKDHSHSKFWVAIELSVGERKRSQHLGRGGIPFFGTVQPDQ